MSSVLISSKLAPENFINVDSVSELAVFCFFAGGKQNVNIRLENNRTWTVEEFEMVNELEDLF